MSFRIIFITIIIPLAYCILFFTANNVVEGKIGVNWGRMAYQRLIPSMVVDLLLQNGISEVQIFSFSDNVMTAFSNTHIALTISIPNDSLHLINSTRSAEEWVQRNVLGYIDQKVNIKYVHVGHEPFSPFFRKTTYYNALDVLRYIQDALNVAGVGNDIKATIPHLSDVLKLNYTKPSQAEFRDDIKDKMIKYVDILKENNSPAVVYLFPILFVNQNNIELEYAFVDGNSTNVVRDVNGLKYTNAFDFMYDSVLWAMKKVGASDLKLVVGEIGWPTDGYPNANIPNAERFFKTLLPKVASNRGTPLLPGVPIDVYIHTLLDENMRKLQQGAFQRHWGIYRTDGQPKFKIDLSGQGRNIYPTAARGVTYMPKRWCVFNNKSKNLTNVENQFSLACQKSDCTSLMPGGSCSLLEFNQSISYAFNSYFQENSQQVDASACTFDGLGVVVTDDPSSGTCVFPVEILAAEKMDTGTPSEGNGMSVHRVSKVLPLLLSILLAFLI